MVQMLSAALLAGALSASAVQAAPGNQGSEVLRPGSPESVGMLSQPLQEMVGNLTDFTKFGNYGSFNYGEGTPIEPGGVTLVARNGVIVSEFAFGKRDLYASVNGTDFTYLPEYEQEAATVDTIYDMASLTKMYTSVAALQQIDAGRIALEAKVAEYLPEFGVNGKENITILMLATHTSGLQPDPEPGFYNTSAFQNHEQMIQAILTQTPINPPGSTYLYSDLNFMTMMLILEKVTGQQLDALIYAYTSRLGLTSTFFNRGNIEGPAFPFYGRMATEEFQIAVLGPGEPQRPQPVRGTVHDENAWALGGVSGHAGLFSTVHDTAVFLQMILNNGTYGGQRILSQAAVDLIFTNFNTAFPGDEHGFGFELDQYYTAGPMANLLSASHTGYTGTTLVADRASGTLFVHFSNRVHPSRDWSSNNIVREAVGYWVATALGRDVAFPAY